MLLQISKLIPTLTSRAHKTLMEARATLPDCPVSFHTPANIHVVSKCLWFLLHSKYVLLLLSHFSRVRLCATPQMAAHQAPPSLGFSRQEHWSGLPFPSPNAWKWKVKVKSFSHVRPSATPWTAAYQAPPSMGFSRQEYWSGVPLPSPSIF